MKQPDIVFGLTKIATGAASYIVGESAQKTVVEGFNVGREAGLAAYNELILNLGEPLTNFLITSGEDLGVVVIGYGIDQVLKNYQYITILGLALRMAIPTAGLALELSQLLPGSTEVFSVADLMIFALPAIYEILYYKKNVSQREHLIFHQG